MMLTCRNCKKEFPNKIDIEGKIYSLKSRKFCLSCSPLNSRNTRSYIIKLHNNEAFCARCKKIKCRKKFYSRKNGNPLSYCIKCQNRIKNLKLEEKLERIIEERGGSCVDCGIVYPIPVYEFYSNKNVYQLSKAKNMSLERIKKDLEKYIMLCKNCSTVRQWVQEKD
jgi:hypothetical protein